MNLFPKKFNKFFIFLILAFIFLFAPSASASLCETVHVNFGGTCVNTGEDCPADKQAIDNDTPTRCPTGQKCCYKTAADTGTDLKPASEDDLRLQIPLFDFSDANNLAQYLAKIYEYILIIFVPFTIIMIIIGGINWILAAGDPGKIKQAKSTIIQAFVGLFMGLTSYIIISLVGITSLTFPSLQSIQRQEGESLTLKAPSDTIGGGAGGGASGALPAIDPNSCTGTYLGMNVKCLDPNLGGSSWDGSAKYQLVSQGPILVSKTIGAPPYIIQYVENSKTAGKKIVALTFDLCSKTSGYKSGLTKYLADNNIKATFFLGSEWAKANSEGFGFIKSHSNIFEIGNHSKTHPASKDTSPFWEATGTQAEMDAQWKESGDYFKSQGVNIKVCRLPVAAPTAMERTGSIKWLKSLTSYCSQFIQYSMWEGDDASGLTKIKSHLKVGRGEIILMHAGVVPSGIKTEENIPGIVSYLKEQGYEFLTVSELLSKYGG